MVAIGNKQCVDNHFVGGNKMVGSGRTAHLLITLTVILNVSRRIFITEGLSLRSE
jgi:hypothetical protein